MWMKSRLMLNTCLFSKIHILTFVKHQKVHASTSPSSSFFFHDSFFWAILFFRSGKLNLALFHLFLTMFAVSFCFLTRAGSARMASCAFLYILSICKIHDTLKGSHNRTLYQKVHTNPTQNHESHGLVVLSCLQPGLGYSSDFSGKIRNRNSGL